MAYPAHKLTVPLAAQAGAFESPADSGPAVHAAHHVDSGIRAAGRSLEPQVGIYLVERHIFAFGKNLAQSVQPPHCAPEAVSPTEPYSLRPCGQETKPPRRVQFSSCFSRSGAPHRCLSRSALACSRKARIPSGPRVISKVPSTRPQL